MLNRTLFKYLLALYLAVFALGSQADVIRYSLVNVVFADGGTATGYFDWDTELPDAVPEYTGASVNFEISTSGGNTVDFPPFILSDENSGPITSAGTIIGKRILRFGRSSSAPNRAIYLIPDPALGQVGVDLNIPLFISPGNSFELDRNPGSFLRNIVSGSIQGVVLSVSAAPPAPAPATVEAVPVDAHWALALLAGLMLGAGLLAIRRIA